MQWWAEANILAALVIFYWILSPILYCTYNSSHCSLIVANLRAVTNTFYSKFLPISAPIGFDNTGLPYDNGRIIKDGVFDLEACAYYLKCLFLILNKK